MGLYIINSSEKIEQVPVVLKVGHLDVQTHSVRQVPVILFRGNYYEPGELEDSLQLRQPFLKMT